MHLIFSRHIGSTVMFLVAIGWTPSAARAQGYDIKAELFKVNMPPTGAAYMVQIRNTGSTIPAAQLYRAEFYLSLPAGATVKSWTPNGWQCSPPLPVTAGVINCKYTSPGIWTNGSILSNQSFYYTGKFKGQFCVRSQLYLRDPAGNYALAKETNTSNNSLCN